MNFPCLYCQKEMKIRDPSNGTFWWECTPCDVIYVLGENKAYVYLNGYKTEDGGRYSITLKLDKEETIVGYYSPVTSFDSRPGTILMKLPIIVKNVTPANLKEKIRTLLTFS